MNRCGGEFLTLKFWLRGGLGNLKFGGVWLVISKPGNPFFKFVSAMYFWYMMVVCRMASGVVGVCVTSF